MQVKAVREQPKNIMDFMQVADFENVVLCQDQASGLRAVIAVHDTTLGPAAGGCRYWTYASYEDATIDAMRLARGMTYKYAAAGVNLGGGKCVVMADPARPKSEAMLRALGRYIDRLGGAYMTGEDVGTTLEDMVNLRLETPYVITLPEDWGGAGAISEMTAIGVLEAMKSSVEHALGKRSLQGLTVNVQGVGAVGGPLCSLLLDEGARVRVADIRAESLAPWRDRPGVEVVPVEEIPYLEGDVFAPCALGGVVTSENVGRLRTKIICGSANNQLWDASLETNLQERGILYAPDFIVNAGGAVFDADRLQPGGFRRARAEAKVREIGRTTREVFALAEQEKVGTFRAAELFAERRIASVGAAKGIRSRFRGEI